ncbi:D-alanyl-D-alanine carboxypeptidase [Rhizobium sp. G21]|nr:D-alanyl-D-alanine carboxypeptidase family protein [Rhizobium sp. G21]MBB1249768.1 D-alanyl-D-alanine carboxypeptidase [Rhizobium sp. G21]
MMADVRQGVNRLLAVTLGLGLALGGTLAEAGPHILVDMKSGKVIEHEDAFRKWYPASLTKLMTAYVAFRQIEAGRASLSTPVVMSKLSAAQPASKMYLKAGDSMTLDDALKLLLVKSANDIAFAIAENLGGSVENYVGMMNAEAANLGMTSSHFINPNGMPGKGQYTTARDLAILTLTLRHRYPQYAGYFGIEGLQVGKKQIPNYNKLIGRFDGADGMKTGFICASGFNQVSTATRDGRQVLSVVLGSDSLVARAELSASLLEKGLSINSDGGMPRIDRLPAYGAGREAVSDISDDICPKKGKKKVRSEGHDDVSMKVKSPYLKPIGRPLVLSLVTITPAGKPATSAAGDDVIANIPIPEPRPIN